MKSAKKFLFLEETEGGMDIHELSSFNNFKGLERLRDWKSYYTKSHDHALLEWMQKDAKVGGYYMHRLGCCIRVRVEDEKGQGDG